MRAEINEFINPVTGQINFNDWQHAICARLMTDHVGPENGISTSELCMLYFGYADLEKKILINNQMQVVRHMLEERQQRMILRSYNYHWYVVAPEDTGGARAFLENRTSRFVRAGRRLKTISDISQETYQLPPGDPLVTAIEGTQPLLDEVKRALELPSGENSEQGESQDAA